MKLNLVYAATILALLTPNVFAKAYLGIEVMQTTQSYKQHFGKKVYKKNPQDYSIFAGYMIRNHWGVEAGYEWQPKRSKNATLVAGDAPPGRGALATGQSATTESFIQVTQPYFGIVAQLKHSMSNHCNLYWQAVLAASVSHLKARDAQLTADGALLSTAAYNATIRNYSKTKLVPMIKLGALAQVHNNWALRAAVTYRNLSSMKVMSKTAGSTAQIKLRDTFAIGLGVAYLFN